MIWSQRGTVDYALMRRVLLADIKRGRVGMAEACDAHPDLVRAAQFHGESTTDACPICQAGTLVHVTYVYGERDGDDDGRVRQTRELAAIARRHDELKVFVVEVCRACSWNHLVSSFVLGTGGVVMDQVEP